MSRASIGASQAEDGASQKEEEVEEEPEEGAQCHCLIGNANGILCAD